MPWTIPDVDTYNAGLTDKEKRKWVSIANSALKTCMSKGGDDASCAPQAIKIANGVLKRTKEAQEARKVTLVPVIKTEQDSDEVADMVYGIVRAFEEDKMMAIRACIVGFVEQMSILLDNMDTSSSDDSADEPPTGDTAGDTGSPSKNDNADADIGQTENSAEAVAERLVENEAGVALTIEGLAETDKQNVVKLRIAVIRPGWGNKVDNHYYPKEVLSSEAAKFIGAKMYETDHRQEEKSTRTWVSTITGMDGFAEDGAPIACVAIHDPGFAERVKNLAHEGLLDKLECSISANGFAQPNFELDGRKGRKITSFAEIESVDWVTRAGAGGRALKLAESDKIIQGGNMEKNVEQAVPVSTEESVPETKEVLPVPINESEAQQVTTPETVEEKVAPVFLTAEKVNELLGNCGLPAPSIARLNKGQYLSEETLTEAITVEREYVKELTKSGQPFGLGTEKQAKSVDSAEIEKRIAEAASTVNKKYFGGLK